MCSSASGCLNKVFLLNTIISLGVFVCFQFWELVGSDQHRLLHPAADCVSSAAASRSAQGRSV